jgi:hypothetical protein
MISILAYHKITEPLFLDQNAHENTLYYEKWQNNRFHIFLTYFLAQE